MIPISRQKDKGILRGQIRGRAWGLRNVADAAWISPDNTPEGAHFNAKVANNVAYRKKVMTDPAFVKAHPLGGTDLGDIRGNTKKARIHKEGADPNWIIEVPWQGDYLCWTWHHIEGLGWKDASIPRDHWLKMRVGLLIHPDQCDPKLFAPYKLVTGRFVNGKRVYFDTWKQMGTENAKLNGSTLEGHYVGSARAAVILGVETGFPGAEKALRWIEANTKGSQSAGCWALKPRKRPGD
jgi:hypothetical protein